MTGASIVQKVISFAYFTLIARSIGVEGTGKYFLALSFTTIFVIFVDLGLTNVFVREAAKAKEKIQGYVSTILGIKLILGILTYGGLAVVVTLLNYQDPELRLMIFISGITMLFDSLHLTLYGVLRAIGDLRYEATSIPGSQLLSLILGSLFLWLKLPLVFLIVAFTIPSFFNVCFVATVLKRTYQIRLFPVFDKDIAKRFGRIAIPFALAAVFARVYGYVDSIILSKLAGHEAVGWYSVPYKITFAFQFIPLALVASLYPRLSEYFATDKSKLMVALTQSLSYLALTSFPIAIGIAVLARPIVLMLYGPSYEPSILPLQLLVISLIFSFASFPLGALLNACNKQATQTTIVGVVMVFNIILNLTLIPRFGATGAAISACAGNVLLTAIGYFYAQYFLKFPHTMIWPQFFRIGFSALCMGLVLYLLTSVIPVLILILLGGAVYVACLFLTRAVTRETVIEMMRLVRAKA